MGSKKIALVGVILLFFTACGNTGSTRKNINETNIKPGSDASALIPYKNSNFDVSLKLPKDWVVIKKQDHQIGKTSINIYKKEAGALINGILSVHEGMRYSYISIWPEGLGT